jgi:hypothetical protein
MAGVKESFEIDLNPDHMAFVRNTMEKYDLADEGKALRIIMDYMIVNPGIHDDVFTEVRCLRCE